ncbi:MAG TPA: polysaccharide deacetylase family protein [Sandaracinaceae bacterium LLY-WYZ-13_1]|nr:polysaccharide deacetylase family protein [Sandaracinaceae bacterium LLY-WYZ-13_1]
MVALRTLRCPWLLGALLAVGCGAPPPARGASRPEPAAERVAASEPHAAVEAPEDTEAPEDAEDAEDTAASSEARVRRVAITVDDIPFVGRTAPDDSRLTATRRLLGALDARDAPATAFVVCRGLRRHAAIVDAWRDAGAELANHTDTHRDVDRVGRAEWDADVRRCHEALRSRVGEPPRWFRYPYLRRGATDARRRASMATVRETLGERIAPVTIDTNDWALARPYGHALAAGDRARAERLADVFVSHVIDAAEHFDRVAIERTGRRDVAHVLLLHANALVADHLGALLDALAERGWRFVSLEEAMRDPVYRREDAYVGRTSMSWLCRFAPADPTPCAVDVETEEAFRRRYW